MVARAPRGSNAEPAIVRTERSAGAGSPLLRRRLVEIVALIAVIGVIGRLERRLGVGRRHAISLRRIGQPIAIRLLPRDDCVLFLLQAELFENVGPYPVAVARIDLAMVVGAERAGRGVIRAQQIGRQRPAIKTRLVEARAALVAMEDRLL